MPSSLCSKPPSPVSSPEPAQDSVSVTPGRHSYAQILKSSAMIGGSSLVNVGVGILRTKAMAVMLGPSGFGLMGLYSAIADLANSVAGMGVNGSGVRQMAEAAGSGRTELVARTATVLRRISVLLGLFGAGVLVLLSGQLSQLTFGNEDHRDSITLLSLAVFFACISGGQGALIQGMRRISDLAKMGVLGSLLGTAISIPLVYFFGERGLVPSIVAVTAMGALVSWWYGRKIRVPRPVMSVAEVSQEAGALLKLGFAFLASALLMSGAAYAVRLILLRQAGVEAAGLYQSAWTLGGLYVGFILQAMGTDFYPRLTGVASDDVACNQMVNQQAQISLLLAGPGVLATLTFAPVVIALFYTPKFYDAIGMLRWICLGMALRVISWPMGFIILAKGAQTFFFLAELAWTIVYLVLAWVSVDAFGAEGAGMAFFGSYVFHAFFIYFIVARLSGFRWLPANRRIGLLFLSVIALTFCGFQLLPPIPAMLLGTLSVAASGVYATRRILDLVSRDRIPPPLLRLLGRFGLVRRGEPAGIDSGCGNEAAQAPLPDGVSQTNIGGAQR